MTSTRLDTRPEENEVVQPRLGPLGFLRWAWRQLTSMRTALFLLCTAPFLTSNVIRMISWIPLLGREGVVNRALLGAGAVDRPVDWLLYSEFAVVLAFVHLYTLFVVVPVFNSLMRMDRRLIEAARDAGLKI